MYSGKIAVPPGGGGIVELKNSIPLRFEDMGAQKVQL
jgi:hypothetical protein